MGDHPGQRKMIESEMDRFEKEISSLAPAPPPRTSFIPTQLRRPAPPPPPQLAPPGTAQHQQMRHHRPNLGSGANAIPAASKPSPSPIIISGAPQVYSALAKPASGTKTTPQSQPSASAVSSTVSSSAAASSTSSSSSVRPVVQSATSVGFGISAPAPSASSSAATSSTASSSSQMEVDTLLIKPSTSAAITAAADAAAKKKKKKKKKKKDDGEEKKPKKILRSAGGQIWEDTTLLDWDTNDFRLFCGDLGNDVTDEVLTRVFGRYPSFQKAKVVRDKRSNKTKGFGFVSFKDPNDFVRAIKELDGRYVGSRPIKLRKSDWKHRNLDQARKKEKERAQMHLIIKK